VCCFVTFFLGRELWGVVKINTVMLECLFIIISFNVNTTQGARGGGWGVLTVQRQAHHTHTGSSKGTIYMSGYLTFHAHKVKGYDRGRSSIDHGSPLTDSRYRSKLIVLHEGSVLQQSLTNMKVSPLFVLERFAYTHTYTSFIRRANRSSRPEPASLQTSKS
jgi:hypothetical protein